MHKTVIAFIAIATLAAVVNAQELPADMRASIDKAATDILAKTGAAPDHPVATNCPETEYLQAVFMRLL